MKFRQPFVSISGNLPDLISHQGELAVDSDMKYGAYLIIMEKYK